MEDRNVTGGREMTDDELLEALEKTTERANRISKSELIERILQTSEGAGFRKRMAERYGK